MVILITIGINRQTFIIEQVLSLSTLLGDAISTIVKGVIEDALGAVVEHIGGSAVVGEGHAVIVDVSEEGQTVEDGGNAA